MALLTDDSPTSSKVVFSNEFELFSIKPLAREKSWDSFLASKEDRDLRDNGKICMQSHTLLLKLPVTPDSTKVQASLASPPPSLKPCGRKPWTTTCFSRADDEQGQHLRSFCLKFCMFCLFLKLMEKCTLCRQPTSERQRCSRHRCSECGWKQVPRSS